MARRAKKAEEPGHNGGPLSQERKRQLSGYITEIERWNGEIKTIRDDVKAIFDSAKDAGFDVKAMRRVIKDRQKTKDEREAFEMVVETYAHALGMLADLPLGKAAMESAVAKAAEKMGKPSPLTDDEKAKGFSAAFETEDGGRMAVQPVPSMP